MEALSCFIALLICSSAAWIWYHIYCISN